MAGAADCTTGWADNELRGAAAGGGPRWARTSAERRAARWRAADAQERLVHKLQALLELDGSPFGGVAVEVDRRLRIARPALAALVSEQRASGGARLRRNVALHAEQRPPSSASLGQWRRAQRN